MEDLGSAGKSWVVFAVSSQSHEADEIISVLILRSIRIREYGPVGQSIDRRADKPLQRVDFNRTAFCEGTVRLTVRFKDAEHVAAILCAAGERDPAIRQDRQAFDKVEEVMRDS